jgi:multiple sugar transport system substrate-binding protein/sn-glycerol 3-phosphate transport system substrate-binding protein
MGHLEAGLKRILVYLIAILGILLGLMGCNQPPDPTPTSLPGVITMTARSLPTRTTLPNTPPWKATVTLTPTPFSTLGTNQDALRGQQVAFWYVGLPSDEIGLMVDTFNSTNTWGIRVSARAFAGYGELNEAVDATPGLNELPDLLTAYNYQAAHWDATGRKLTDLNVYVNDPLWGLSAQEQADFYPVFWWQDVDAQTSKRYGLPFHHDGLILFYNVTWANELGFTSPPATTRDFERQVCAAAQANQRDGRGDNNATGGWVISPDPSALTAWLLAFDASLLNTEGNYTFDTAEADDALAFLKQLGDDGCAWQSPAAHPAWEFADRKALVVAASSASLVEQQRAMSQFENGDEWRIIPFPGVDGRPVIVVRGPALVAFESSAARQLAAWLFARWLVSPESQARRIAADGGYPSRVATLDQLRSFAAANPHWQQAADLVLYARSEPGQASWAVLRWVMVDALFQLYAPNFAVQDIPALIQHIDQLAVEASIQYP